MNKDSSERRLGMYEAEAHPKLRMKIVFVRRTTNALYKINSSKITEYFLYYDIMNMFLCIHNTKSKLWGYSMYQRIYKHSGYPKV